MSNKKTDIDCFFNIQLIKKSAVFIAVLLIFSAVSCTNNESDDKTMTDNLLKGYMNSLCTFDIAAMNQNNLYKIEEYSDSDNVKSSCKIVAEKISWEIENVNINGSTAIAQVKITLPKDIESICSSALNDTMIQIEQKSDQSPSDIIRTQIKKYADSGELNEISTEISMSKAGNKWFISKSSDVAEIISDIRTPVAAVYSIIEQ